MGHTAILIGAAALGIALLCLFAGYRWGRSNVRSQIEDALDMARVSADAREFALREQLDEKMLEVSELRAQADEVSLLREQLEQLQSSRSLSAGSEPSPIDEQSAPENQQEPEPFVAVAENPIQSFFHPKTELPQTPVAKHDSPHETQRRPAVKFPSSFTSTFSASISAPEPVKAEPSQPAKPLTIPVAVPAAAKSAKPVAVQTAKPPQPAKAAPAVNNDDWDEFAKSLEALKKLQK
jgi:hypothetical protein